LARQLDGYSRITFPQCGFETKEGEKGFVTLSADFNEVLLKIRREDSQKVKTAKNSCFDFLKFS
jgi:tRNA threonylcarbamoyladenosine modification (KEOPS) complex  Pcc1 subunit